MQAICTRSTPLGAIAAGDRADAALRTRNWGETNPAPSMQLVRAMALQAQGLTRIRSRVPGGFRATFAEDAMRTDYETGAAGFYFSIGWSRS